MTSVWESTYGLLVRGTAPALSARSGGTRTEVRGSRTFTWIESERHPLLDSGLDIVTGPEALVTGAPFEDLPKLVDLAIVHVEQLSRACVAEAFELIANLTADRPHALPLRAMVGFHHFVLLGAPEDVDRLGILLRSVGAEVEVVSGGARDEPVSVWPGQHRSSRGVRALRQREFVRETMPALRSEITKGVAGLVSLGLVESAQELRDELGFIEEATRVWSDQSKRGGDPGWALELDARTAAIHQRSQSVLARPMRSMRAAGLTAPPRAPELALAAADGYATAVARRFDFVRARVLGGTHVDVVDAVLSPNELLIELPAHLAHRAGAYPLMAIPIVAIAEIGSFDPGDLDGLLAASELAAGAVGHQVALALSRFGFPGFPAVERTMHRAALAGAERADTSAAAIDQVREDLEAGRARDSDPVLAVDVLLAGAYSSHENYVNEAAVFADLIRGREPKSAPLTVSTTEPWV